MHKNLLITLLGVISLLLNGCTTVGNIDADLKILRGQSIEEVATFLDNPDNHHELSNSEEYIWVNTENVKLTLPNTTARHSASQSGEYPGVSDVTNFGTKTDWYNFNCKLTLITDKKDIITSTKVEGDAIGCRIYKKVAEIMRANSKALARCDWRERRPKFSTMNAASKLLILETEKQSAEDA